MRKLLLLLLGLLVAAVPAFAGRHNYMAYTVEYEDDGCDDCEIDIRHGRVIVEDCGRDYCRVEITEDFELYIDGKHVKTDAEQQKLLRSFYEHVESLRHDAKEIGWEGAKIGVEGAKLGLFALTRVAKLLSPGYDTDDLEREVEREAEKIEERAEEIEEMAEVLEDRVDELESLADDLDEAIPELDERDWF